jgi:hypothetical protein
MIGPWNKIGFRQIAFGGGGGGGGTNTPLETTISNQPHALAYITPSEEGLLRSLGGTGQAGPGGVPAFPPAEGGDSTRAADLKAAKAAGKSCWRQLLIRWRWWRRRLQKSIKLHA